MDGLDYSNNGKYLAIGTSSDGSHGDILIYNASFIPNNNTKYPLEIYTK